MLERREKDDGGSQLLQVRYSSVSARRQRLERRDKEQGREDEMLRGQ